MFVKPLWFSVFGVTEATPQWLRFVIWLAMVFPTYQAFLLIYGFLLGQFKFFWAKEKAMFNFMAKPFRRTKADN